MIDDRNRRSDGTDPVDPELASNEETLRTIWNHTGAPAGPEDWRDLRDRLRLKRNAPSRMPGRWGRVGVLAAAAAAVLITTIGLGTWLTEPELVTVQVPAGETYELAMASGVHATINAVSTLEYLDAGKVLEVWLEGEAFFDVDGDRSLVVHTGEGQVRDVGTAFNVRARDGRTEVAVAAGVVEVMVDADWHRVDRGEQVIMTAGALRTSPVAVELAGAWRRGVLRATEETLGSVAAEIARRYDISIEVAPELTDRRITAVLVTRDGASAVTAVCDALGATCKPAGDGWLIQPTRP